MNETPTMELSTQALSEEDLAEIGLDEAELERCRELAENPELENFYVAHAWQPKESRMKSKPTHRGNAEWLQRLISSYACPRNGSLDIGRAVPWKFGLEA